MNSKIGIILAVVAIVLIGGAYFLFQNPAQPNSSANSGNPNPDSPNSKTASVNINNFAYSPSTLTIKKGDTLIWTNSDSVAHTVTSDSGLELDSELLSKGQTYSHTFNTAGTFAYHCTPHPSMKATIIVE